MDFHRHKHTFIITGSTMLGTIIIKDIEYKKIKTYYKCSVCGKKKEAIDYHSPVLIIPQ
jgi:hypothetical protein